MCVPNCIHYQITSEMYEQAIDDQKMMAKQKGEENPTTLVLNKEMNIIGSLAQNAVINQIRDWGIDVMTGQYFDSESHNDEYDFLYSGFRCDVQGSTMKPGMDNVFPGTNYLFKNQKKYKPMDYYVPCSVSLSQMVVHMPGVVSYTDLWENYGVEVEYKIPSHMIAAKELRSLRWFIFRV